MKPSRSSSRTVTASDLDGRSKTTCGAVSTSAQFEWRPHGDVMKVGSGSQPPRHRKSRSARIGDDDNQGEIRQDRYTSGHHLPRLLVIDSSIEQNGQAGTDENEVRDPTE